VGEGVLAGEGDDGVVKVCAGFWGGVTVIYACSH